MGGQQNWGSLSSFERLEMRHSARGSVAAEEGSALDVSKNLLRKLKL
jgi:hypothetical protein